MRHYVEMKIAVLNNCVPFTSGGAEHLATALNRKLQEYGHDSILVRIPFRWYPAEKILDHMLACRCLRLAGIDRVIGLKFPAYYVPHPNKVLWLLHQFRQAYDLWGTPYQDLPSTPRGIAIRNAVIQSDNNFLSECEQIYTISPVTRDRLNQFNGIPSTVLFHPLERTDHLVCRDYGDYIFYPSRITGGKRQHLVVESMRHVQTGVRLVIAGGPETPDDLAKLEAIIEAHNLGDRVRLLPQFISEDEKAELFSNCLACAYTPYDEDSYGYVTLEACHCRKAVVTCSDSGGTRILVRDGVTGFAAAPEPQALAAAFDRLYSDRRAARTMGEAGYELMRGMDISWDRVVKSLTS
jgi:glycosyltransferase involved in cell wall biosynthesis